MVNEFERFLKLRCWKKGNEADDTWRQGN